MNKICGHCKRELPLEAFGRDRSRKDGLFNWCKKCNRADCLRRFHEKTKKQPVYIERSRIALANRKQKIPEKLKARSMAGEKVQSLKKAVCEKCGETNDLQMHHPDYARPLDVVTLCIRHHFDAHYGAAI
jgi:hypothetical protein